jgi:glycosyltransferase involved in cell wall biosynthesis
MGKQVRILTNFARFPEVWKSSGYSGSARVVSNTRQLLKNCFDAELIIINCDVPAVLTLCFVFFLFPFSKKRLVAVDLVLRKPKGLGAHAGAFIKRLLLARVNHFVNYFRDLEGYRRYYGIGPTRSSFVFFKPNIRDQYAVQAHPDGEYVLCFGRSLRNYDSFIDAVAVLPYPSAIPVPNFELLRAHGSRFSRKLTDLPDHLTLLEDNGTPLSLIKLLAGARIVVIPIVGDSLCASGIGTYLNAMLMGKCVIISAGPGASDVLSDEAIIVPADNTAALIDAIRRVWEDSELREKVALSGQRFAESLGGEQELLQRILDSVIPRFYTAS